MIIKQAGRRKEVGERSTPHTNKLMQGEMKRGLICILAKSNHGKSVDVELFVASSQSVKRPPRNKSTARVAMVVVVAPVVIVVVFTLARHQQTEVREEV